MARQPRIDVPDCPHHLIWRGNNRGILFRDDVDRWVFLNHLGKALVEWGCDLHAFVLMTNHVHMLATPHEHGAMSRMMHLVGTRFARWVNLRHGRTGYVFENRFRSSVVEDSTYLLTCMRYIELNPVRAGMVNHPGSHPWSSYAANAAGVPDGILTPHPIYLALGSDGPIRGRAYARLVEAPIEDVQLAAIRASVARARGLGSPEFLQNLARALRRPIGITPHGGCRVKGTGHQVTRPLEDQACDTIVLPSETSNFPGASTLRVLTTPSSTSIE
jgi:putative transposase